ncbi:carbohydate-binding domain-containing protein [Shewanella surugensis]|uniref:N-acetyl-beta-glucosaminidase n=1 Tax=Shewanella surugensis TaxID=212020 RepID=A0ABT0LC39_9GAMM|nr:carbohydate-binding domain-containing protein [Shewanella surugensis]MCL1125210.1 carbohydate-binding domain-containing protein [Shewanella surugensis]
MIFLKKKLLFSFLSGIILSCIGCNYDDDESAADTLADNLVITFEVLTNDGVTAGLPCSDLGADGGRCNKVNMTLINEGKSVYSTDWTIYFHYIRQILDLENDKFKISHITGDLYQIEPTEKFDGFAKDDIVVLPLISEYWNLSETDFLSKAFIVSPYFPPR